MNSIILFLLTYIQYLHKQINELLFFISKFIPLNQFSFEDSLSPKYQKFKVDRLPVIIKYQKLDYLFLLDYYLWKYNKPLTPISRKNGSTISPSTVCPRCNAPHEFIYANNGSAGQLLCKVCKETFLYNSIPKPLVLKCPYCGHTLEHKKSRLHFNIHKCTNDSCSYYLSNLKNLPKGLPSSEKFKFKLRYIYREFVMDFFKMDLYALPSWATSFNFRRNNSHIMGLVLTYHVNLGLSLRKTSHALKEVHGIDISHTMVANYAKTAAVLIKPFVDSFDYNPSGQLTADETYIKVKGLRGYVWLIADKVSRSILGYHVSDNRGVAPCILTMRIAMDKFKSWSSDQLNSIKFVADGYSAYLLAAQQFNLRGIPLNITQVVGLTNDDAVSEEYRPFKQVIERLNRTFKSSYRVTCGYDNQDGADLGVALWVAYYNFLRPHKIYGWKRCLNHVEFLSNVDNMPGKWQLLIYHGQQTILNQQIANSLS